MAWVKRVAAIVRRMMIIVHPEHYYYCWWYADLLFCSTSLPSLESMRTREQFWYSKCYRQSCLWTRRSGCITTAYGICSIEIRTANKAVGYVHGDKGHFVSA
jgi:hypothetical protein